MIPDEAIGSAWIDVPLGESQGPVPDLPTARPFGLRYASDPQEVVDVEWADLSYDPAQQMAVVDDQAGDVVLAMKHTSTKTKTTTNSQDRKSSDDDSDSTGS